MIADILIISSSYNLICSSIMFEANNFMDLCTGFFSLKGTVNLNPYELCLQLPLFLLLYISFHCQQSVSSVVLPPRHLTLLCFSWVLHSPSPPIATSHSVSSHWNGEKGGFLCLDFFKCKIGQYKYFFFFYHIYHHSLEVKLAGYVCAVLSISGVFPGFDVIDTWSLEFQQPARAAQWQRKFPGTWGLFSCHPHHHDGENHMVSDI